LSEGEGGRTSFSFERRVERRGANSFGEGSDFLPPFTGEKRVSSLMGEKDAATRSSCCLKDEKRVPHRENRQSRNPTCVGTEFR